ncbi:MAG: transcription antitermination factor NusB [Verrucomicrobiota bacterium]
MASRREIREAVVQFLYCADLEGGADPTGLREPFWEFVTESDRRGLQLAIFRTVIHLAHGREGRLEEFHARFTPAAAHLAAHPQAENQRRELQRIAELETAWNAAFDTLERLPRDQEDATVAENFSAGLARFFQIDRDLAATRQRFLEGMEDLPALRGQLEAVAASVRRLQRVSDRLRMVEEPEKFPDQGDLAKLRDSKASILGLRQKADMLVDAVLANKEAIDRALAAVVENFSPERIDPVDRAVLRLATYEIQMTTTPAKVAINEAIELAKRFGTTDSHRFVNGVLDQIAKQTPPSA